MIKPRPHQKETLNAIKKGFEKYDLGQCIMACGTGKSYVAAWAVQQFKARTALVLVPSLSLVRQLKASFEEILSAKTWSPIAVCSDKTVAGRDEVMVDPRDLGCTVTTDPILVRTHLKQRGMRVVFCTYQSAPLLKGFKFDLGIFDEAHKTAGRSDKSFGFALHDANIGIGKRLFFTATPRMVRLPVDSDETDEVASMDDPQVYGPRFYDLPFREAVDQKIICDYKLVVSTVEEDVDTEHHTALQVSLQKSMDARGIKKVFVFNRSVDASRLFASDTEGFDASVQVFHVDGGMSTEERSKIIAAFKKAERAVLTNARCLTEGVDVPAVDMVVFAHAKRSTIDIVQAAGRAMRNSPGKEKGYIFIPVWQDTANSETFEDAARREGFKPLLDVLNALTDQDTLLEAVVEDLKTGGGGKRPREGGDGVDIIDYEGPDIEELRKAVSHAIVEQKRPVGYWSFERCKKIALGFSERNRLRAEAPAAYDAMVHNGWLTELTVHMPGQRVSREEVEKKVAAVIAKHGEEGLRKNHRDLARKAVEHKIIQPRKKMDRTACAEAVLGCKTRKEVMARAPGAYAIILENGWDDLLPPSQRVIAEVGDTSREALFVLAKQYDRVKVFRTENPWAYVAALKAGWIPEMFPDTAKGKWTPAAVEAEIAKHSSRKSLKDACPGAYKAAVRLGILDRLLPVATHRAWTLADCQDEAYKYSGATAMQQGSSGAYSAAATNGWLKKLRYKKAA